MDRTRDEYMEALTAAFHESVERPLSGGHAFGVSLSGGLDSRAILSAMNGHDRPGHHLHARRERVRRRGHRREARRAIAGTPTTSTSWTTVPVRVPAASARMVSLTDGMYLSHGLTEMLALGFSSRRLLGARARPRRRDGEDQPGVAAAHGCEDCRRGVGTDELVPYLFDRINYISPGLNVRDLFTDPWARRSMAPRGGRSNGRSERRCRSGRPAQLSVSHRAPSPLHGPIAGTVPRRRRDPAAIRRRGFPGCVVPGPSRMAG